MKKNGCSDCSMRAYYDRKPRSILGRIWRWHLSWCPGWKTYLNSLPPDKKKEMVDQYQSGKPI